MASASELWDGLMRRPARKTLSLHIPPERVLDEVMPPPADLANAGYFQVRLAEMYLRDERKLLRELVPATLLMSEFKYGAQSVRLPFFVSNQMLQGMDAGGQGLDKIRVRFKDTRVVGPVPYLGDEVALFVGLFSSTIRDNKAALFAVFEKLFGAVDAGTLSSCLKLADKLSDELFKSLGHSDTECVLAERNVYGTARQPLRDGYAAMLNCESRDLDPSTLHVMEGMLHTKQGAKLQPFAQCDYCLVKTETSETRNDYTTLPFHKFWEEARGKLLRRDLAQAKAALIECQQAVLSSCDLTEDHKYRLIEFYQAAFVKDQARFMPDAAAPAGHGSEITRGSGSSKGAELELKRMRARVKDQRGKPRVLSAMEQIESLVSVKPGGAVDIEALQAPSQWEGDIARHLIQTKGRARDVSASELASALTMGMLAP